MGNLCVLYNNTYLLNANPYIAVYDVYIRCKHYHSKSNIQGSTKDELKKCVHMHICSTLENLELLSLM